MDRKITETLMRWRSSPSLNKLMTDERYQAYGISRYIRLGNTNIGIDNRSTLSSRRRSWTPCSTDAGSDTRRG